MKTCKLDKSILFLLLIVSAAIVPANLIDSYSRNSFLLVVMAFSPLILISYFRIERRDLYLLAFAATLLISPVVINPDTMRWSTIIYTWMFISFFLAYKSLLLNHSVSMEGYLKIIRLLILAYFITLVVQQVCVLFSLPIPNVSHYRANAPWKLNSLATEPSHAGRVVGLLMFSYILITEQMTGRPYRLWLDGREDRVLWFAFAWTMLTMGSATAIVFVFIILMVFLSARQLLSFLFIAAMLVATAIYFEHSGIERVLRIVFATLSLNEAEILDAERSGAYRVVPVIATIKMVGITTVEDYFGHGVDYLSDILYLYVPGLPVGATGGGLPQLWVDYGMIPFALFLSFSLSSIVYYSGSHRKTILTLLIWILTVFVAGINNQLLWFSMMVLVTNKYFVMRSHKLAGQGRTVNLLSDREHTGIAL